METSIVLNVLIDEETQTIEFHLTDSLFNPIKKADLKYKSFISNSYIDGTFFKWFSINLSEFPCSSKYYHRHDVESFRRAINHLNDNNIIDVRCVILGQVGDKIYPILDLNDTRRKLINTKPKGFIKE